MKKQRPEGLRAFNDLVGKLAKVPKKELATSLRKERKKKGDA